MGVRRQCSTRAGGALCRPTRRNWSPSLRSKLANLDSHRRRVRQYRVEHRLQVAGRARDDAQHLGRRCLLLPRLGKLARTRLKLLLQLARVRLELLFRRRLRFLRPADMTHAGHPQAEDPPIKKHTTPAPLLCETVHTAGPWLILR